uniref:Uncharacterized protein n=1 Tax=Lygus hesperus TaxID=30085 RepID=A0A146KZM3_LYGHE
MVRDVCAKMADLAYRGVGVEPIIREGRDGDSTLVADLCVRGLWERERAAFFDNRNINADGPSYFSLSWTAVAERAAREKHTKYDGAAEDARGSFSPIIRSCEGVLHPEFQVFLRLLTKAHREVGQSTVCGGRLDEGEATDGSNKICIPPRRTLRC